MKSACPLFLLLSMRPSVRQGKEGGRKKREKRRRYCLRRPTETTFPPLPVLAQPDRRCGGERRGEKTKRGEKGGGRGREGKCTWGRGSSYLSILPEVQKKKRKNKDTGSGERIPLSHLSSSGRTQLAKERKRGGEWTKPSVSDRRPRFLLTRET